MELGRTQTLTVIGPAPGGWWVGDHDESARLEGRLAPAGVAVGQELELFVGADREGVPFATPVRPHVEIGRFACLEVVETVPHGVYFGWGLPSDLFVPRARLDRPLSRGARAVVTVFIDPEGRLLGSTRLNDHLEPARDVAPGAEVRILVSGPHSLGVLAVVDDRYSGLVYRDQTFRALRLGDTTTAFVSRVRPDGRLDLALQRVALQGQQDARAVVWQRLIEAGGFLPLTDDSEPEAIRNALQMSKKVFKKAVGSLYRDRKITLEKFGIRAVPGR